MSPNALGQKITPVVSTGRRVFIERDGEIYYLPMMAMDEYVNGLLCLSGHLDANSANLIIDVADSIYILGGMVQNPNVFDKEEIVVGFNVLEFLSLRIGENRDFIELAVSLQERRTR